MMFKITATSAFYTDSISETIKSLQEYTWPGNIRGLEQVIERAVITSPEPEL
jgi:DNA-binding NtrC family response regulator